MLNYTSASANKRGIVPAGESIQYETKPVYSCLVLIVGLIVVAAIATFILTHI